MFEVPPLLTLGVFLGLSFVAIHGWGTALKHAMGLPALRPGGVADFWIGYLFALGAVEFFNLWFPIDWRASLVFYAGGTASFLQYQKTNLSQVFERINVAFDYAPTDKLLCLAWLSLMVLACLWAMALPVNEDSWLYHFQSILWINEYSIVPGLGNLHGRLAFNQSYFGYLALLNFFPYGNKGYAVGGLLLLLASTWTVVAVMQRELPYKKFLLILLLLVLEPMAKYPSSPSPDFAVSLLQIVGALYLLFLLYSASADAPQRNTDFWVVVCVSAALCSVKLSGLIFAAALCAVALWSTGWQSIRSERQILRLICMLTFFGLVHLARGVITSGVPLYPSTFGAFLQFDWSVPMDRVRNEAGWIISCARTGSPCLDPNLMLHDWSWVHAWWNHRVPDHGKTLFFLSLAANVVTTWINWRGGASTRHALLRDGLLVVPFFSALAFWFFTAPDVRFLGRLLELMFAFSMWSLMCSLDRQWQLTPPAWAQALSAPTKALQALDFKVLLVLTTAIFCLRLLPLPGLSWQALPEPVTGVVRSASGVGVQVPGDGSCWYSQLPCAPTVDPRLEYREPRSADPLAHGFRLQENPH